MLPNESVPNSGTDLRFPEHTDFRTVVGTTWRESISLQRPRYPLPSGARTNQLLPLNQGRHGVLGGGLGSSPERSPDQPGPSPPGSGAACAGTACPGSTPRALGGAVSSDWGLRLDGAAGCGQRGCWVVTEFPRCPEKPGAYWLLRHGPVTGPWGLLAAGPGGDTVCLLLQKDTSPLDSLSFTALPSLRALSLARKGYSPVHRHTGLRGPQGHPVPRPGRRQTTGPTGRWPTVHCASPPTFLCGSGGSQHKGPLCRRGRPSGNHVIPVSA